jgi:hypothetical protein
MLIDPLIVCQNLSGSLLQVQSQPIAGVMRFLARTGDDNSRADEVFGYDSLSLAELAHPLNGPDASSSLAGLSLMNLNWINLRAPRFARGH